MDFRLGVEDMEQNHWVAFVLDLPGCFSSARTQAEAVALAPMRISAHLSWLRSHGHRFQFPRDQVQVKVEEVFHSYVSEGMYVVNAYFKDDQRPLAREEIEEALSLLEYSRHDLIELIERIPPEKLRRPIPGEVQGSIMGILEHVAWAEWWYFDRLNRAFDRAQMPADPFEMLTRVRTHTQAVLPALADVAQEVERSRELWSPRKVIRRTLWHERDHTRHIEKLTTYI